MAMLEIFKWLKEMKRSSKIKIIKNLMDFSLQFVIGLKKYLHGGGVNEAEIHK